MVGMLRCCMEERVSLVTRTQGLGHRTCQRVSEKVGSPMFANKRASNAISKSSSRFGQGRYTGFQEYGVQIAIELLTAIQFLL